mgnify:CR=1 FL=1
MGHLTIDYVARDLDVSRRTIQRYISNGRLPALKLSADRRGAVRISREDYARFLDEVRIGARA